jgi:hypothetical protein
MACPRPIPRPIYVDPRPIKQEERRKSMPCSPSIARSKTSIHGRHPVIGSPFQLSAAHAHLPLIPRGCSVDLHCTDPTLIEGAGILLCCQLINPLNVKFVRMLLLAEITPFLNSKHNYVNNQRKIRDETLTCLSLLSRACLRILSLTHMMSAR